jgi:phosphoserine phosphatase
MADTFVATLIAGPQGALSASLLDTFAKAGKRWAWVVEGRAADLFFDDESLIAELSSGTTQQPFDILIQKTAHRRKKLMLADMESTIIEQEMLDELAEAVGLRDKVADITRRAMNGELDFPSALKERVGLLRGLPVSKLDEAAKRITYMSGAEALLKTMKANDTKTWLVSGGFTYFAEPVAKWLGFDKVFANELILRDGIVTGDVAMPLVDKNTKKTLLMQACDELGLALTETMTVGDGANDIPMLSACNEGGGLGVAYHAKPNVRAVIRHQINHGDLTALAYAQGSST